jgi:hypothetical protein
LSILVKRRKKKRQQKKKSLQSETKETITMSQFDSVQTIVKSSSSSGGSGNEKSTNTMNLLCFWISKF